MIVSIDYLYWLAGLVLAITALMTFADREHPRRLSTGLFWALYALVFLVGDKLPPLAQPVTRTTLTQFAGGSGDYNPLHVDIDFARRIGRADVIAHGMLSMAYLGRLLTQWVPQAQLRTWNVRFLATTPVNVTVTCRGEVVEKFIADGERRLRLSIEAEIDGGVKTLAGEAVVAAS